MFTKKLEVIDFNLSHNQDQIDAFIFNENPEINNLSSLNQLYIVRQGILKSRLSIEITPDRWEELGIKSNRQLEEVISKTYKEIIRTRRKQLETFAQFEATKRYGKSLYYLAPDTQYESVSEDFTDYINNKKVMFAREILDIMSPVTPKTTIEISDEIFQINRWDLSKLETRFFNATIADILRHLLIHGFVEFVGFGKSKKMKNKNVYAFVLSNKLNPYLYYPYFKSEPKFPEQ